MISAQEARIKTNEVFKSNQRVCDKKVLADLEVEIKSAMNKGDSYISTHESLSFDVKAVLENLGYKVRYNDGDYRDPDYYTISW